MKNIIVYLRNKEINASGYYRIYQYFNHFEKKGNIKYRSLLPNNIYRLYYNNRNIITKIIYGLFCYSRVLLFLIRDSLFTNNCIIVINREISPIYFTKMFKYLAIKMLIKNYIIWDFDDNIKQSKEISDVEWLLLERYSDKIIVTNDFLKNCISYEYRNKVKLLSTTDGDMNLYDIEILNKKRILEYENVIKIVWVGTFSNLKFLRQIISYLDEVAEILLFQNNKQLVINCVCDIELEFKCKYLIINNTKWSRKNSIEAMKNSHIGVMPLLLNDFTKGKGGFKIIQYMAIGLPVIVSNVGFNTQIVDSDFGFLVNSKEEWIEKIIKLSTNLDMWIKYSYKSKNKWDCGFSFKSHLNSWEKILHEASM